MAASTVQEIMAALDANTNKEIEFHEFLTDSDGNNRVDFFEKLGQMASGKVGSEPITQGNVNHILHELMPNVMKADDGAASNNKHDKRFDEILAFIRQIEQERKGKE